ncbi:MULTISPECIES: IS200/IS605 family accessory protein TnpB-related protein [unclassified Streptomyces]|uniref:Transposase n=1 Tax=Streptomyces sp. NBC_00060 TaxID=2975636 RepID=A0AAU2H0J1_9ACTN
MTVKTRLRLSPRDANVLRELGFLLSQLAARDLAERVALGTAHTREDFARRKRGLTALTSSRWAGTITRGSNEQWELARRAQAAHLESLNTAVARIVARLAVPVGTCDVATRVPGYPTQRIRAAKQQRLQHLRARATAVAAERAAGRIRVVRGGKDLLRSRMHLPEAGLSVEEWRRRWSESRTRIEADGESGKTFGNESIQIAPDGVVLIKLPPELAARYSAHCDRFGRYRLDARVRFGYREPEWRAQVNARRSVGYTVRFANGRCCLTAAFTPRRAELSGGVGDEGLLMGALTGGVLGVDHNADHLAAWRLDRHGNPVGRPDRIDVDYKGRATHRDAQVRHACSGLIRLARQHGATALVVEDLGFTTDRETCGGKGRSGRRFRSLVAGMPTARFVARLVAMAHRAGLAVIVVDPAYTSRWGVQHWRGPTSTTRHKTSRHDASAVVIGRRGQGLGARRRAEKTVSRRQTEAVSRHAKACGGTGTEDHRPPALPTRPGPHRAPRARARPEDGARDAPRRRLEAGAQSAQDRSGRAAEERTWVQVPLPPSE